MRLPTQVSGTDAAIAAVHATSNEAAASDPMKSFPDRFVRGSIYRNRSFIPGLAPAEGTIETGKLVIIMGNRTLCRSKFSLN